MSVNLNTSPGFYFKETDEVNVSVYDQLGSSQRALREKRATRTDWDILGVGPYEGAARAFFTSLLGRNLTIESSDKAGIFWVLDHGNKVAVFKVGCRRATLELLARRVTAEYLKVESVSWGLISVMRNLDVNPLESGEDICVPTWRGRLVSYPEQMPNREQRYVIGLTQPYFSPMANSIKETSLSLLVLAVVAIGASDIKEDAIFGSGISVDTEQCFPERFPMPFFTPYSKVVSMTDLPFLSAYKDRMHQPFSEETMRLLKEIVSSWDIESVIAFLNAQHIRIVDQPKFHKYEVVHESIDPSRYPYPPYDYLNRKINPHKRILLDSQIAEIKYRIAALRYLIENREAISLHDLVFCVDSYGGQYYDCFEQADIDYKKRESALEAPCHVIGRKSPENALDYPPPEFFGITREDSTSLNHSFCVSAPTSPVKNSFSKKQ